MKIVQQSPVMTSDELRLELDEIISRGFPIKGNAPDSRLIKAASDQSTAILMLVERYLAGRGLSL